MSKQLGILFKGEMVRAILEGRKTQTRRGLPIHSAIDQSQLFEPSFDDDNSNLYFRMQVDGKDILVKPIKCPWRIGDYLYVKETWWSFGYFFTTRETTKTGKLKEKWLREPDIHFAADHEDGWEPTKKGVYALGWWRKMSSLFLSKDDARIWLKVTNVRVERLLDISEADAIAEGITEVDQSNWFTKWYPLYKDYSPHPGSFPSGLQPKHSYITLWDSINGAGSHKENPWVWVIEFERCEKPN